MSTARDFRPHYTVRDYLSWEGDWELWYGSAVAMASPFAPHERCVTRLTIQFSKSIESGNCKCEVYTGLDWIVSEDVVVRPDVMIVCGDQPERHLNEVPSLAVEVLSESTRSFDLGPKKELYQEQGVPHYLIADPTNGSIRWYELNGNEGFKQNSEGETGKASFKVRLPNGCELELTPSKIFG
jgi:Uma2 family endonuclease